jgi:hypothetical protein
MSRPTKFSARLSALLMELRQIEIAAIRARWRACPATMHLPQDAQRSCGECKDIVCMRMRKKGLDDAGIPLTYTQRPNCGAMTRSGLPCANKVIPSKTRCKFHGGLSTGAKTQEGKAKIAAAQKARWDNWRVSRER